MGKSDHRFDDGDPLRDLAGGDRRSIGKADGVAADILGDPGRFADIVRGLRHADPLIRMRSADVAEKVTLRHPDWLQPHKAEILALAATSAEKEVRWHLAQMLPRLALSPSERDRVQAILLGYLDDGSRIVQTCALQALADLATDDAAMAARVLPLLGHAARNGPPSVKARAIKPLERLEKTERRRRNGRA